MYQYILFDLDGTLTDPGVGITNSVAYALKKFNINVKDKTELYKFIAPPLLDSFVKYYGFSEDQSKNAIDYFREYFRAQGIFENEVYEGIEDMLTSLKSKGKKIILATSKPDGFANEILKHFQLDKYFDFVAGATMDETRTKKGDVIKYALESCGINDMSTVIMIGDREHDIIGAKECGIDSIGVLFGYGSYDELHNAGATYIAETVEDIVNFI